MGPPAINPARERDYNARAAVPEHPAIFAAWRERSAAWRARAGGILDVVYGDGPNETLDIFPAGVAGAPLQLFFHGGYWQAMDKSDFSHIAEALVPMGVTVAVANYALCPAVSLDTIVKQARRAVVWLRGAARRFGADPSRLQVAGHSAGGHLAAMLLATDWPAVDAGLPRDVIASAVAISGLFDLTPLRFTTINAKLGLDEAAARRNSPILMRPRVRAPLLLAVGERESPAFHEQSAALAERWRDELPKIERLTLVGCHHFAAVDELARPANPLLAATHRLFDI